jgi:hypothetical protein
MLVSVDERPPMDEEDIYIPELVGMSVILQVSFSYPLQNCLKGC